MNKPKIKEFYQIYKKQDEDALYIGVGPDKIKIGTPSSEIEEFIQALDGTNTINDLLTNFPSAEEWLSQLTQMEIIEDADQEITLDPWIAERWNRQINHLKFYERNGWSAYNAQEKLWNSRVVVVGTGAGGTTLLRFLNAVGIGTLEAVEFDNFALDNLATHMTLDEEDVGLPKLEALKRHLTKQNSRLKFVPHHKQLKSVEELADVIRGADFFVSAFDRPRIEAARWSSRAAIMTGVPLGSIGVTDLGARVGPIVIPGKTPCFECVGIASQTFIRKSEKAALMGTMVATLAGIMVHEIVKVITAAAPSALLGRSLYINTRHWEFNYTPHQFKANCFCETN